MDYARWGTLNSLNLLKEFVRESNLIEGIYRDPSQEELQAHEKILELDCLTVDNLREFCYTCETGAHLREKEGMNVRVGGHYPPNGGKKVVCGLVDLLDDVNRDLTTSWEAHCEYEQLHPFMDCNGRSGRIIWLWMEKRFTGGYVYSGFLQKFYYQTLNNFRTQRFNFV